MNKHALDMKAELVALKAKGRKLLAIDRLIEYCDLSPEDDPNADPAVIREDERRIDIWRTEIECDRESNRLVVESGFQALKTLVFVAAGTSAALLAFLGSIWNSSDDVLKAGLSDALMWFAAPIFGGAVAYGLTYLFYLCAYELEKAFLGSILRRSILLLIMLCYSSLAFGLYLSYIAIHP